VLRFLLVGPHLPFEVRSVAESSRQKAHVGTVESRKSRCIVLVPGATGTRTGPIRWARRASACRRRSQAGRPCYPDADPIAVARARPGLHVQVSAVGRDVGIPLVAHLRLAQRRVQRADEPDRAIAQRILLVCCSRKRWT
jgi:hypothetical protein